MAQRRFGVSYGHSPSIQFASTVDSQRVVTGIIDGHIFLYEQTKKVPGLDAVRTNLFPCYCTKKSKQPGNKTNADISAQMLQTACVEYIADMHGTVFF